VEGQAAMSRSVSRRKFGCPIDRAAVAADWRARGFSCDLFVDPPGREWLDFKHQANELLTVAEGRLEVTIGDEAMIAEPGDEIYIPRGVRHSLRNICRSPTRWLYGYD
jgi:mannose-6-phosphate isomerase-like protein (cupin superfamily)